jgi:hypothetical protein
MKALPPWFPFLINPDESLCGAGIDRLDSFREAASGNLSHFSVIPNALAAETLPAARLIRAGADLFFLVYGAFLQMVMPHTVCVSCPHYTGRMPDDQGHIVFGSLKNPTSARAYILDPERSMVLLYR